MCRLSSTVMRGKMCRPSGTCAMPRCTILCIGRLVMSSPSKVMEPSRARGLPQMVIRQRGLARPVGADQGHDLARPDSTSRFSTPRWRHSRCTIRGWSASHPPKTQRRHGRVGRSGAKPIPAIHQHNRAPEVMDGRDTLRFAARCPAMTDDKIVHHAAPACASSSVPDRRR